ncbi:acyl carrier protein [Xenorhabdus entomophaga]
MFNTEKPSCHYSGISIFLCNEIKNMTGNFIPSTSESIATLGINSLQMIQLINRVNEKYNLKITPREFITLNTLDDVINLIEFYFCKDSDLDCIII